MCESIPLNAPTIQFNFNLIDRKELISVMNLVHVCMTHVNS